MAHSIFIQVKSLSGWKGNLHWKTYEFQISDKLAMLYIDKDISLLKGKKCSDFEVLFINSDSNKRNQKNRPNSARQSYRWPKFKYKRTSKCNISHRHLYKILWTVNFDWTTHLMNKYIFLVVISREDRKTKQVRTLCGRIGKCKWGQRGLLEWNESRSRHQHAEGTRISNTILRRQSKRMCWKSKIDLT